MEDIKLKAEENRTRNKVIKDVQRSNALAFRPDILSKSISEDFGVLNKAFEGTPELFAKAQLAIKNGSTEDGEKDLKTVNRLQGAPKKAIEFMENLIGELSTTDSSNFDINNNAEYSILNAMINKKPGFSKNQGFDLDMKLLDDGTQELTATGPGFKGNGLTINSGTLNSLLEAGSSIVAETPPIEKDMQMLLNETQLFDASMVGPDGNLSNDAKISEEFILRGDDGEPIYETVPISKTKARKVLKFDQEKIASKINPFVNAEIASLFEEEEGVIAAWNTYIEPNTTKDEDMQTSEPYSAGKNSWSYENDLPLTEENKELFSVKYKKYFTDNYLKQFTKNQAPFKKQDQETFDIKVDMKNDARLQKIFKKFGLK